MKLYNNITSNIIQDINTKKIIDQGTIDSNIYIDVKHNNNLKNIQLKSHQQLALGLMKYMEEKYIYITGNRKVKTSCGIYGDKTGSGKSITIISRIISKTQLEGDIKPILNIENSCYLIDDSNSILRVKCNVIVVHTSKVNQWKRYIQDYTDLCLYIIKNQKAVYNLYQHDTDILNNYDIILISSNFYSIFCDKIHSHANLIVFSRLIVDDADQLILNNCQNINVIFTWYITSVLENLLYLRGTRYSIKDGFTIEDINKSNNWDITQNMLDVHSINCIRKKGLVLSFFKRLYFNRQIFPIDKIIIKINDKSVEKSMNLPKVKKLLYKCRSSTDSYILKYNCKIHGINNLLNRLACNKLTNLEDSSALFQNLKSATCCICCDKFKYPIVIMPCCSNKLHLKCIIQHLKISNNKSCPLCRQKFDIDKSTVIHPKFKKYKNLLISKSDTIAKILKLGKNYIIYTDDKTTIDEIYKLESILEINLYDHTKGKKYKIDHYQFKSHTTSVILINNIYKLTSYHFETVTDIIVCNKYKHEDELINKCQRIGRITKLNVHYLYKS